MKKTLSLMLAILLITIFLVSCAASGKSILISRMFTANNPLNILNFYESYTENLPYTNSDGSIFEYSIYTEYSSVKTGSNNIVEKYNDMTLYVYDGDIYILKNGEYYSIVQLYGTYNDFTYKYIYTRNTDFDNLTYYQKYSKEINVDGEKYTEVGYQAVITPEIAAKYSTLGLEIGNDILIVYLIKSGSNLFSELTYYQVSKTSQKEFLKRTFKFSETKENLFSNLPTKNDTVNVTFVIDANDQKATSTYTISKGTKLGIETLDKTLKFYTNEEMTEEFNFDSSIVNYDITIYGKFE